MFLNKFDRISTPMLISLNLLCRELDKNPLYFKLWLILLYFYNFIEEITSQFNK